MTRPITPDEAENGLGHILPDFVIQAVNNLLLTRHTTFTQEQIIEEIRRTSNYSVTKADIFEKRYLYFEHVFRAVGWKVTYDKPGYNETYPARFIFEPNERSQR